MKKLIALLLAAVMVLGLAACGGSSSAPTTAAPAPAETEAPAAPAETEAPVAEPQTVIYWAQWSETETQADVIKNAIARFEANHPEYKVEVNWAGREVRDILRTSLDAGQVIDVIETGYDRLLNSVPEDLLVNITEYVEKTTLTQTVSAGMAAFAKGFASDGQSWYYIPSQPFVGCVFYNKAIFREAGIEKLPETWAEFQDCCEKIKAAGYYAWTTDDAYADLVYSSYLGAYFGKDTYSAMMNDPTHEAWSSEGILQMGNEIAAMVANEYITPGTGAYVFPAAQNTEFGLGTTAMYINATWLPNEIAAITGDEFEWGMMFYPLPTNGAGIQKTYMTGCQFYAVPKTSTNPEAAVLLIEELTSEATQKELLEQCQCIPMVSGLELPASLADAASIMAEGESAVPWAYCVTTDADISTILKDLTLKLLAGELTGEEFAAEIDAQIN